MTDLRLAILPSGSRARVTVERASLAPVWVGVGVLLFLGGFAIVKSQERSRRA